MFSDHSHVARAGGAPLLTVSRDATTLGAVSIDRVAVAASPAVHRVLVAGASTLEFTGMFELTLEGVATRAISVDASANDMQNVSFGPRYFMRTRARQLPIPSRCCRTAKTSREEKIIAISYHDPPLLQA